jgi:hypothetical protein
MEDYRGIKKVNQSSLKKILTSPKAYLLAVDKMENQDDDVTPDHFIFGSVVDIMLMGTREDFEKRFVKIPDETKCSETVQTIVAQVFAWAIEEKKEEDDLIFGLSAYNDFIADACTTFNYQSNWKPETKVAKIIEQGSEYFNLLKTMVGRTPVTETEYANAVNCVMALKADTYTKQFVDAKFDKNMEFINRFIVEFEIEGVEMKGELDRVAINHETKRIFPIDFKTTSKPVTGFEYEFWKYRYDFQAATYGYGLNRDPRIQELLAKGYTVAPFLYIVVEKQLNNNPMVFAVSNEAMTVGFVGGEAHGREYEGLKQALLRYNYAVKNNAWEYPMEYYDNEGSIFIRV